MSVSDPYGLLASGLPPDLAAQYAGLTQQQAIAEALMAQGQAPLRAPEVKGRFQGRISPMEGVAKVLQAYLGAQGLGDVNKGFSDIATQRAQQAATALQGYQAMRDGTPATPASSVPYNDAVGDQPPQPDIQEPGKAATAGNPRAAVAAALINPMLAHNPLVAADLDAIKKAQEPYSLKRDEQRFQGTTPVATGLPTIAKVDAVGPDGSPVTKFVPERADTPAIPQPVKKEMVNAGATIQPVNPYSPGGPIVKTVDPDAALHANVTMRGQNMTDARTRELNGILDGTSPAQPSPDLVDAIGNYDTKLGGVPTNGRPAALNRYGQLLSAVKQKYPDYSEQNYDASQKALNAFSAGKEGAQTRFLGNAVAHMELVKQLAAAQNNGDAVAFNTVANKIAQATGSPAPTNLAGAMQIVGGEVVKAIANGGGGVADREHAASALNPNGSPAQQLGTLQTWQGLLVPQLNGLRRQYETTTRRKDFDRFLSDEVQALSDSGTSAAGATAAPGGVRVVNW